MHMLHASQESGRVIECYPDAFAVIGSERYFVGHPCDWCVSIGRPDGQGGLEPIPLEGELMDEVRKLNIIIYT
jgi:hypothetical protein